MKKALTVFAALIMLGYTASSQTSLPEIDKSPLDICYYPTEYPQLKTQAKSIDPAVARVIYSRPKKEGRPVFGNLVEYGKLWRLGANEATEIEFFKPVMIGQKKVAKGRYTLYAIVNEKSWTFILNKDIDIWGSFKYKQANDVLRLDVPVQTMKDQVESLAMTFERSASGVNLVVAWENVKTELPITL
ncbi:DUF2911 domain-containing protein [Terrimonas sp. NA20]|uniref:DUF2911 domain-containing protein n=1 Tax=Terrimonas ginsenosidimutans TaxID=2908004 RepID=A0ABS9L030_9BACT|nr:DUF2911 domain-containing protein [Terrimonas ginsenosidimutans]MCG2617926.1 DUF2911 domain-containing protein [Terrimonas ginsenosidimutans]